MIGKSLRRDVCQPFHDSFHVITSITFVFYTFSLLKDGNTRNSIHILFKFHVFCCYKEPFNLL